MGFERLMETHMVPVMWKALEVFLGQIHFG